MLVVSFRCVNWRILVVVRVFRVEVSCRVAREEKEKRRHHHHRRHSVFVYVVAVFGAFVYRRKHALTVSLSLFKSLRDSFACWF